MTAPAEEDEAARQDRIQKALAQGDAPLKAAYLLAPRPKRPAPEPAEAESAETKEPDSKRKRHNRGMNKAKDRQGNAQAMKQARAAQLCPRLAYFNECEGGAGEIRCSGNHDVAASLAAKPPDISPDCPALLAFGVCPAGLNCRFGVHIEDGKNVDKNGVVVTKDSDWAQTIPTIGTVPGEFNIFGEELRGKLRKKTYDFSKSEELAKSWQKWHQKRQSIGVDEAAESPEAQPFLGPIVEAERRSLDLVGKRILAPLTTVGNLPFRRLCVQLGAEVTVGEMALASTILEGGQAELALLRRHESEKIFGVQIAGGDVEGMTKVAQFVDEHVSCEFLDINCACPLDDVHKRGAGSRLMDKAAHLEGIVRCMSTVMHKKALTIKLRTAHVEDHKKNPEFNGRTMHKLVSKLEDYGVSAIFLHGRTARQRYTKLADWDYVKMCTEQRERETPFIGLGDVLSWEDVEQHCNDHGVQAVMIARGALIKPWLFTEVAERRHWDISATERLDMIKDFARYGLEHWGADSRGVETTRRFLLEWLSFTCRYIPIGLLEVMPPKMNWRPRPYCGRSDLETKMASMNAKDWIELTEMVLGNVPEGFTFTPKHKSASYEPAQVQAAQTAAEV